METIIEQQISYYKEVINDYKRQNMINRKQK